MAITKCQFSQEKPRLLAGCEGTGLRGTTQTFHAPRFEPTDEQRAMVERAAGLGVTQDNICALLGGMSKHTLENHFREELDRGIALIQYKVGSSLVDNALNGNVKAQMFYLTRRAGWKETQVIENKVSRLDAMSEDEIIKELADRANKLGVKIDVNIGERHPHGLDRNHRSKRRRPG